MDFIRLFSIVIGVVLLGAGPVARAAEPASAKAPANTTDSDSESLSAAANAANNPLARLIGVNIQNDYTPQWFQDPDLRTNALQLRVVAPVWRILPRLTLPLERRSVWSRVARCVWGRSSLGARPKPNATQTVTSRPGPATSTSSSLSC